MKRRRTLIVSLLLVAALCMGVGYAAVSGTLTINGTATYTAQTVELTATAFAKTNGEGAGTLTPGNPAALAVTNLSLEGDSLVGTLTVVNNSKFNVNLTNVAITNGAYCTVTCLDDTDAALTEKKVILAAEGGTVDLKVSITLNEDYIGQLATADPANQETFTIVVTGEATNTAATHQVP